MDDASAKYLVGHDTSPMRKPKYTHCAQHLIVEDEIVGIFQQRQSGQHLAAENAESRCGIPRA